MMEIEQAKKSLFSHADPSLAIREMKTVHTHLHKTKALLHESLSLMGEAKVSVANSSSNLRGTSAIYDSYEGELRKADLYVKGLRRKQEQNARKIKFSFWVLVGVAIFVIFRRLFMPALYRNIFKIF